MDKVVYQKNDHDMRERKVVVDAEAFRPIRPVNAGAFSFEHANKLNAFGHA